MTEYCQTGEGRYCWCENELDLFGQLERGITYEQVCVCSLASSLLVFLFSFFYNLRCRRTTKYENPLAWVPLSEIYNSYIGGIKWCRVYFETYFTQMTYNETARNIELNHFEVERLKYDFLVKRPWTAFFFKCSLRSTYNVLKNFTSKFRSNRPFSTLFSETWRLRPLLWLGNSCAY